MGSDRSRREELAVRAVDPADGSLYELTLSYDRIRSMALRGRGAIIEASQLVGYVLQHPTAIFEGIRRDTEDPKYGAGWRCYCGTPPCAYDERGDEVNPPPGQVYLVFVNDEEVVYNWRWDRADPDNGRLPVDHATRFRERLL